MLYNLINHDLSENFKRYCNFEDAEQIINALESAWVNGSNSLSVPHWADIVGKKYLATLTYTLSKAGWITSSVQGRYGSFSINLVKLAEYMTPEQQLSFRTKIKVSKYRMRCTTDLQPADLVRTPNGIHPTGAVRPGFAKCANKMFKLDTQYLVKYYDAIQSNLIKSIKKMAKRYPRIHKDKANYGNMSTDILDWHIFNPEAEFNLEANISDQRHRATYLGTKRIFNIIASKDARSLMISSDPVVLTLDSTDALKDIYLFIAELIGTNAKSWGAKTLAGKIAYENHSLHVLDLQEHITDDMTAKQIKKECKRADLDRKDLHENIWLERIYAKLDRLFNQGYISWDIPLEKDATMSLAQIIGVLTNDARLLDRTNVVYPYALKDAWTVEGVPRLHTKTVGTPKFYGSGQTAKKLLASKNLTLTKKQMSKLAKEFTTGGFATITDLKDFFIKYSNVATPTIETTTWNETYTITVNKYKCVGANIAAYTAYDTASSTDKTFMIHNPIRIPDYERFKLFYPTGLIHNLDSKIMDNTMNSIIDNGEWAIAIHDAGLVMPGTSMGKYYVDNLEQLRLDRHIVIDNYRKSIGATGRAADIAFAKLMNKVVQLPASTSFSPSALK